MGCAPPHQSVEPLRANLRLVALSGARETIRHSPRHKLCCHELTRHLTLVQENCILNVGNL